MAKKKKQHFVPRMYLRRFANSDKKFYLLNLKNNVIHCGIPCESQCYKNYFYGSDCILEDSLADKECKWAQLFQRISSNTDDSFGLSQSEKTLLKEFAVFQRQRTEAESAFVNSERKAARLEYVKSVCAHRGWKYDEEALKDKIPYVKTSPAENLNFVSEIIPYIDDLEVVVINYNTESYLVSSDVPVVSLNEFSRENIGYASMGLIMLYPIDLHRLVVVYDAGMYGQFKGKSYVISSNEEEVYHLNILQYISADKIVYGIRKTELEKFNDEAKKLRSINRDREPIDVLGNSDSKLISYRPRGVITKFDFSFGHLNHQIRKIPYSMREAVPRQYDIQWEGKLKMKEESIPFILSQKHDLLQNLHLTIGDSRKGCHMMLIFAQNYWRRNGSYR